MRYLPPRLTTFSANDIKTSEGVSLATVQKQGHLGEGDKGVPQPLVSGPLSQLTTLYQVEPVEEEEGSWRK